MNEAAPVCSFRWEGRMGRLSYATCGSLSMALVLLAALHLVTSPTNARVVAYGIFLLALAFLMLRWTVLRLHDINLSGWWSPLMTLPYAGPVINLVLSLLPGTAADNDHGQRPRSPVRPPRIVRCQPMAHLKTRVVPPFEPATCPLQSRKLLLPRPTVPGVSATRPPRRTTRSLRRWWIAKFGVSPQPRRAV